MNFINLAGSRKKIQTVNSFFLPYSYGVGLVKQLREFSEKERYALVHGRLCLQQMGVHLCHFRGQVYRRYSVGPLLHEIRVSSL
ncbi:hypothetical protein L6164_006269 [Bauhinia variegata]|uniref:Uncharacterized protein n=1 Tax=Bauhinia variegata TaxID=167791 RepID=A0ACB9PTY4_BAUVA|nr:hypothetical protein L6164_006269 [Bauhinia variegata]